MNFVTKEPINKGWSSDKKYCVTDENGTRYLLRVSDIAQHDTKQSEFNMMKQVASFGVPMCQPIEFGTCEDGVYSIQSWIDGEDAEQVMSGYSDTEQYVYGLEAGRILRKIHSIPAPATQEDWEIRFNRKMDYKIKKYVECPIKYENGQAFIDYINENHHLLKNRPFDERTIVFGEVGLSGEVRAVNMPEQRVAEAKKLGFETCIVPEVSLDSVKSIGGIKIIGVKNINEAIGLIE